MTSPDRKADLIARAADKLKHQVIENLDLIFERPDALEILRLYLDGDLAFAISRDGLGFVGEAAEDLAPPPDGGTGFYL